MYLYVFTLTPDGCGMVKLKTPADYTGRQISFALSMTLLFLDLRSLNRKKGRRLAVIKVKLAKRGGGEGIALILLCIMVRGVSKKL
jgi:hypothetical protein